jgi:hypothetical protein
MGNCLRDLQALQLAGTAEDGMPRLKKEEEKGE